MKKNEKLGNQLSLTVPERTGAGFAILTQERNKP